MYTWSFEDQDETLNHLNALGGLESGFLHVVVGNRLRRSSLGVNGLFVGSDRGFFILLLASLIISDGVGTFLGGI